MTPPLRVFESSDNHPMFHRNLPISDSSPTHSIKSGRLAKNGIPLNENAIPMQFKSSGNRQMKQCNRQHIDDRSGFPVGESIDNLWMEHWNLSIDGARMLGRFDFCGTKIQKPIGGGIRHEIDR